MRTFKATYHVILYVIHISGEDTPVTAAVLKSIVQLITDTKTEANRHALHHGSLVLLSKIAVHFPARVLDHMMPIFTFMGDTTLRMDDQYSLQVSLLYKF